MEETDSMHEIADPLHGIFPDTCGDGWIDENDTFCVVCGVPLGAIAPVLEIEKEKYKWCLNAIGIRPSSLQRGTDPETSRWHPDQDYARKRFHGDGKPLEILSVPENFEFFNWDEPEGSRILHHPLLLFPWVGVHRKCFNLMQRLVEYRKNVMRLFQMTVYSENWRQKSSRSDESGLISTHYSPLWKVLEPHRYYYNGQFHEDKHIGFFGNVYWPWGSRYTIEYEAAPFPIEDLASQILYYLEPLPASSASISAPTFQFHFNRLPEEIQQQIFHYLHPFTDPPAECTRCLAHSAWRDLLFHGQILPWLWDLDESMETDEDSLATSIKRLGIDEQDAQSRIEIDEDMWDWELLVRQLARHDSFKFGGILESLPRALLNRRRIWRLLDEARQDDVDPFEFRTWDPCKWSFTEIEGFLSLDV